MSSHPDVSVPWASYPHEVLAAVLSVRDGALSVLAWQRGEEPHAGAWSLPDGGLEADERLRQAILRHLDAKVDVREVAHLEQLVTHSNVDRDPRDRVLATAYLGLVPTDVSPDLPADTAWHRVDALPPLAFDHGYFVAMAVERLRAKLSYTNVGFALVPEEFTMGLLSDVLSAALGHRVDQTNVARVVTRRGLVEPTGTRQESGPGGGRPAMTYRFRDRRLTVTDPFAVLKPPKAAGE